MDFLAMIEQAGLRLLNGQRRVQAALSAAGQQVMARDANGLVYRIAMKANSLVVEEVTQQADGLMVIVAPVRPITRH